MNFRGFLSALVILSALAVAATAQAPAPATTAFDGRYVGTATEKSSGHATTSCATIISVDMTITGGQVVIHETAFNGAKRAFQGSVNAAGEVSTSSYRKGQVYGPTVDSLTGTIHENVFAGLHRHGYWCYWNIQMAPALTPAMPFDGWYRGVSREVLDSGSDDHHCYPRALEPPHILTIANGVIETPNFEWWEGTVGSQGAVMLHNPQFSLVDARIDAQGTIRGQYTGDIPPRLGGGTNCIVKFVWQKE